VARASLRQQLADYRRNNDPATRYTDLAVRLVACDRNEADELVEVGRSRVFGGLWDTWGGCYVTGDVQPLEIQVTRPQFETICAICPRPGQPRAQRVLVSGGRGGGKSQLGLLAVICWALENPYGKAKLVAPTYDLGREALWEKLFDETPFWRFLHPVLGEQKAKRRLVLLNFCRLQFAHAQNETSLRAGDAGLLLVDERQDIDQRKVDVATFQLRKRADYVLLQVGTAKAGTDFEEEKKRYEAAAELEREVGEPPRHVVKSFTSYTNCFIPHVLYEDARRSMDPKLYEQEVLGKWVVLGDTAYHEFERDTHVQPITKAVEVLERHYGHYKGIGQDITAQVLRQKLGHGAPNLVGMDFNVSPMVAVVWRILRAPPGVAPIAWAVREIIVKDKADATRMGMKLKKAGFANSVIVVDCNAQHSVGGASSATFLRRLGFKVIAPATNPNRVDRKNAANAKLRNAAGEITMFFDPACKEQIRARQLQEVDQDGKPTKDGVWDHHTDAGDYPIYRLWPVEGLTKRFGYAA